MRFNELHLKQFKCFDDTGAVPLAPLTLIFGKNNSGKSSLLQSLFLLQQSQGSSSYGPRLNLSGALYSAGSFTDLAHLHDPGVAIEISLGLQPTFEESNDPETPERARLTFAFRSDDPQPPTLSMLQVQYPGVKGSSPALTISRGQGRGEPFELRIGTTKCGGELAADFRFPVNGILPLIGDEPLRRGRVNPSRAQARVAARQTLELLDRALKSVRVAGAFRSPPERRYDFKGAPSPAPDAAGRNIVDALIQDSLQRGKSKSALLAQVNQWLKQVARVQLLPLRPLDQAGKIYELQLRDLKSGRWANFADVGYGIGQALPVLVEGLRTPLDGVFIVQEPEIHLHPDAQLAMADFLVELMRSGRQVIVETHSEHLLLRVRRRILAGEAEGLTPEQVSILYVDKDQAGASRVGVLPMDQLGQVSRWPPGFLQEANQERLALLEAMAEKVEEED